MVTVRTNTAYYIGYNDYWDGNGYAKFSDDKYLQEEYTEGYSDAAYEYELVCIDEGGLPGCEIPFIFEGYDESVG